MIIYGKKMYVYNAAGGVYGVSAEGDDVGKILWKTADWSPSIGVPSPLYLGNNEIAVFGSYGASIKRRGRILIEHHHHFPFKKYLARIHRHRDDLHVQLFAAFGESRTHRSERIDSLDALDAVLEDDLLVIVGEDVRPVGLAFSIEGSGP